MNDLFEKRSAKDKLLDWIRSRNWAKTSDVIRWGAEHYSNRALRNAQQLAHDGFIKRMDDEEKRMLFGPIREDVWKAA